MSDNVQKLRVGIAGYGVVGKRRHEHIEKQTRFEVVGLSDIKFRKDGRSESGILCFSDYRQLFAQQLDVLFVCLPNYLAAETTIAGLEENCHVFCEKPPGRSIADVLDVIKAEDANPSKKLKYGFNHRYHDSVVQALRIIESGELGSVVNLRGVYGKSGFFGAAGSDWRSDRSQAGGGILLDQGIHLVDLMRLFAGEFSEVKSFVENGYWKQEIEDNAYVLLRTKDGVVAMLHSSATQLQHKFELEISMQLGTILLSGILSGSKSYGEEKITVLRKTQNSGSLTQSTTKYLEDNSWRDEIEEFLKTILNDQPVLYGNSTDALRSMELVFKIYCADSGWREKYNIECV